MHSIIFLCKANCKGYHVNVSNMQMYFWNHAKIVNKCLIEGVRRGFTDNINIITILTSNSICVSLPFCCSITNCLTLPLPHPTHQLALTNISPIPNTYTRTYIHIHALTHITHTYS